MPIKPAFWILGAALLVTSCASDTRVIDTACTAFGPLTFSRVDTPETVNEILAHNAAWEALCDDI